HISVELYFKSMPGSINVSLLSTIRGRSGKKVKCVFDQVVFMLHFLL
ncbi:MAG: hypothetical protein MOP49_618, partial [Nitrososphaera sp.]|nr:hypothetical protein [Nitrososphaera sp.]